MMLAHETSQVLFKVVGMDFSLLSLFLAGVVIAAGAVAVYIVATLLISWLVG